VSYNQAQVANARLLISGDSMSYYSELGDKQVVTIAKPQATKEGLVQSEKTEVLTETVALPATDEEARAIVEKFQHGADSLRGDTEVSDSVSQHLLDDTTGLLDEKWLGTEEEELNAYVDSLRKCFYSY